MNKNIEEMINDPAHTAVIGFTTDRRTNEKRFFVCIMNKFKLTRENLFIDKQEIELYEKLIKKSEAVRAQKKLDARELRRLRDEAKMNEASIHKAITGNDDDEEFKTEYLLEPYTEDNKEKE